MSARIPDFQNNISKFCTFIAKTYIDEVKKIVECFILNICQNQYIFPIFHDLRCKTGYCNCIDIYITYPFTIYT